MTHPQYTSKFLSKKGLSFCKKLADELGLQINGDKRLISTYVNAITAFQASQFEAVEQVEQVATIERTADDKYAVVVNGVVHQDFYSYMDAERCILRKGWTLLDTQSVAQGELETEIEIQAEISAPEINFKDIEFGYVEATVVIDDSIKVLANIYYDFETQVWSVNDREEFESYAEAENWVIQNATALSEEDDHRGSGRVMVQAIEEIAYTIEDMRSVNHHGNIYEVRICGDLIGNIFNSPQGWTINSIEFYPDWLEAARDLEQMYIYCTA